MILALKNTRNITGLGYSNGLSFTCKSVTSFGHNIATIVSWVDAVPNVTVIPRLEFRFWIMQTLTDPGYRTLQFNGANIAKYTTSSVTYIETHRSYLIG
jgi:hypothetical protein